MANPTDTSVFIQPNKRSVILPGMAADRFYDFSVRAYRRVDSDINADGVVYSPLTPAKNTRYRPSVRVSFNGNITGTIMDVAASQVISDIRGMTADNILSRAEKPQLSLVHSQLLASSSASAAKARQLGGIDAYIDASNVATKAWTDYIVSLVPAYNDMSKDTPINAATFQTSYAAAVSALADLDAMIADRAAQLAKWDGVTGANKPDDNADVTGDNTSKDTNAVGGKPAVEIVEELTDAQVRISEAMAEVAKAFQEARQARAAAAAAGLEIDQANQDLTDARTELEGDLAGVRNNLANEIARSTGEDAVLRDKQALVQKDVSSNAAAIEDEKAVRATTVSAVANRTSVVEAKLDGKQDSPLAASIRDASTAAADATRAIAGRTAALEARATGGGNLLQNTAFETLRGYSITNNPNGGVIVINAPSDDWHPIGENALAMRQSKAPTGSIMEVVSEPIPVSAGEFYQCYAMTASHRSRAWVSIMFYDVNGAFTGYGGENVGARVDAGGKDPKQWDQTGVKSVKAPPNTVSARICLRTYGTGLNDTYVWIWRPFIGVANEGQTGWIPYSPGSEKFAIAAANAAITDSSIVSAAATKAVADRTTSLESKVAMTTASPMSAKIEENRSTLAEADRVLAGRTSVIEASAGTSSNLLSNTEWTTGNEGWGFTPEAGSIGARNGITANIWWPNNMNALVIGQENASTARAGHWSQDVHGLEPGATYQATVYSYSHRCNTGIYIDGFTPANAGLFLGEKVTVPLDADAKLLSTYKRTVVTFTVPAGYSWVRIYLMKHGTTSGGNSYAWFLRPQLVKIRPGITEAVPYTPGSNVAEQTKLNATIIENATTAADANRALASRSDVIEAQLRGARDSELNTRIYNETIARTDADVTMGNRVSGIESTATIGSGTGKNDKFAIWPYGQVYPTGWAAWVTEGQWGIGREPGGMVGSPYAAYTTNIENAECGIYQTVPVHAGKWVIEVTAQRVSGSLSGAGVTLSGVYNLDFLSDPDTTGRVGDSANMEIRTWTKMIDIGAYSEMNLHCMHSWTGFGRYRASKYIKWGRLTLRPASVGEIEAGKAAASVVSLTARVKTEEDTRLARDSALATRADTVEAQLRGAQDSELNTRIYNEAVARANADSVAAGRTSIVEASVGYDSNNLVRNGTFTQPDVNWIYDGGWHMPQGWSMWAQDANAYYGPYGAGGSQYGARYPLQIDRQGNQNGLTQALGKMPPGWYTFEVDVEGQDGNWSGAGVHCQFNNGYSVEYGFHNNADTADRIGNIGNAQRKFTFMFYNGAQSPGVNLYLMAGWTGFTGAGGYGFLRTIWHRIVMRPSTAGEIASKKVEQSNLLARVTTAEGAVADLKGRASAYWQVQSVAGNNRAQMRVWADANAGAGVDIIGDVRITGANGNGSTTIGAAGVDVYYSNGQRAVRLGI